MKTLGILLFLVLVFTNGCKDKEESGTSPTSTTPKPTFSITVSTIYGQGSQQGKTGTVKNTSNVYANQVFLKVNRTSGSNSINLGSLDRFESKSFDTGLGATITSLEVTSN